VLTFVVTDDTEIEFEDDGDEGDDGDDDGDGSTADLITGTQVVEIDLDDDGTLEEIELLRG